MRARLPVVVRIALATVALAVGGAGPVDASNPVVCRDVVSAARATATVARVDASNGAALAVPAYYSQLIYDSIPQVAYNQSGPTTTGQLEDPTGTNPQTLIPTAYGFLPVDPPPDPEPFPDETPFIPAPPIVGRAEAAFPALQGIPRDSTNAVGASSAEAHAHPTYSQGRASGTGLPGVRAATSFTHATMACETLTLVVGWEATGLVTDSGTIPSIRQVATLVVSPTGARADVATNVADETEEGSPIVEGRPLDDVFAPFNENGTFVDVGEPRLTVEDGVARVHGGGVRYGTADPSRNDTFTFYSLGALTGEARLLSVLPAAAGGGTQPAPRDSGDASVPSQRGDRVVSREVGDAPDPSPSATAFAAEQVGLAARTVDLTTGSLSLWPFVLGLVATALLGRTAWFAADRSRGRLPTAGFAIDRLRERRSQFVTTYLKW